MSDNQSSTRHPEGRRVNRVEQSGIVVALKLAHKLNSKHAPPTRYVNPTTGRSVVLDNTAGELLHVGGNGFEY